MRLPLCFLLCSALSIVSLQSHASVQPRQQAVASAHPYATQAGLDILNAGGNAFDAAIAVASVLAVVEPYSSGFGGGGFWLTYQAKDDRYSFIDGREKAPANAHSDIYLDEQGKLDKERSINGPSAAGIPGQAAALVHLSENYGLLPLKQTLAAAIGYAQKGFPVDEVYRKLAGFRLTALRSDPTSRRVFLLSQDVVPEEGSLIVQTALANTLKKLAESGRQGFYEGETAKSLVTNMSNKGGFWSLKDLDGYEIVERQPIKFSYQGHHIVTAPPPSAGGIALAQMFGMLDHFQASGSKLPEHRSVAQVQLLSEVMRRAYRDRAEYLGDPDFTSTPENLLQSDYHNTLAASIELGKATPSANLRPVLPPNEGTDTTHYSIIDKQGNRVSATLSINLPFGAAYTDPDTGLLLNNEMDDFSSQPGVPNAYGLVATKANGIEPGKRPLSSMSPTMMESEDEVAILGTPGGSRIITMVFLGMLEHIENQPVDNWVSRERFHHQYLPDVIQHEPGIFTNKQINTLNEAGYQLKSVGRTFGNMQAILWNKSKNEVTAASDPRRIGEAVVE